MPTPISRANYSLSMIKVIMCKFSPVNCETILISIKTFMSRLKVNCYLCFKPQDIEKNSKQLYINLSLKVFEKMRLYYS